MDSTVTEVELAALTGMSTRNVRDYAKRGVFVKAGRGYAPNESIVSQPCAMAAFNLAHASCCFT
jgi:phage terminase Nu1 subunit (DNA packaging protein)